SANNIIGRTDGVIGPDPDCYYSPDPSKPYFLTFLDKTLAEWNGQGNPPAGFPAELKPYLTGGAKAGQPVSEMVSDTREYTYFLWQNTRLGRYDVIQKGDIPINPGSGNSGNNRLGFWEVLWTNSAGLSDKYSNENPGDNSSDADNRNNWTQKPHLGTETTWIDSGRVLVPNDSKMYQMKLALWRLLSPPNAPMLSRMRVGVVGNFFDYLYSFGAIDSALYRNAPYKTDQANFSAYHSPTGRANNVTLTPIAFPHGTAPEAYSGIKGGDYGNATKSYQGVMTAYGTSALDTMQRHASRGYLRVPFDYLYTMDRNGQYAKTPSLYTFLELIDGVEQYDNRSGVGSAFLYLNEELMAGGTTNLANVFYGRDGTHTDGKTNNKPVLDGKNAIDYFTDAVGAKNPSDVRAMRRGLTVKGKILDGVLMKRVELSEKDQNGKPFIAGTALGSVLDFFSPAKNFLAYNDNTRGYFPVLGSCQSNWVIVFTGGNELQRAGQDSVESLKKLYLNSREMRGRRWTGEKWVESTGEYRMDNSVRTIFVGLMPAPDAKGDGDPYAADQPGDSGLKRLRKNITRMAHAGQPHENGTPNRDVTPYFADNVPALINAIQSVLVRITSDRFSAGAPVVLPYSASDKDEKAFFSGGYAVSNFKQWAGSFRKYRIDADGVETRLWSAEEKMSAKGSGRSVFTSTSAEGSPGTNVSHLNGISDEDFAKLTGLSLPPSAKTALTQAFRKWLLEFEETRAGGTLAEDSPLGDPEHSGITVVDRGKLPNSAIPADRRAKIYMQTNRGSLHAFDYETGDEDWAFIPPNIFQGRLKNLKFLTESGSDVWYDGNGYQTILSKPLTLLDGMLSAGDIRARGSDGTLLIGNLGWGGNGFYAMDITTPGGIPNFLWAIDNARYADAESNLQNGVKRWGKAAGGPVGYDYGDLGLTVVAAEILQAKRNGSAKSVGFLPGGLGYKYGQNGDTQGRAFYVFDPENGEILKKFTNDSGFAQPAGVTDRKLGMGIAPLVVLGDPATGEAREVFTGDSEGNVLYAPVSEDIGSWTLKSVFQVKTVKWNPAPYAGTIVKPEGFAPGQPVAVTRALELARSAGTKDRWVFGGTSNLNVPDYQSGRKLTNNQQFIFAANLTKIESDLPGAAIDNLIPLLYLASDDTMPSYGHRNTEQVKIPEGAYGWYLLLRPKLENPTHPTDAEYVTTSPFLYSGVLYVSTFISRSRNQNEKEMCPELGDSKLYAFNPMTGRSAWPSGKQALVLDNVKVAGLSILNGKMFFSVKVLSQGALTRLSDRLGSDVSGFAVRGDNVAFEIDALNYSPGGGYSVEDPEIPHVQYWKERFQ
ncbi:MAG: hypothetical protein LBL51_03485, partial [Synergistaceae bacterium]|nr:hypothetical protein [Synergistaceae bacterium]